MMFPDLDGCSSESCLSGEARSLFVVFWGALCPVSFGPAEPSLFKRQHISVSRRVFWAICSVILGSSHCCEFVFYLVSYVIDISSFKKLECGVKKRSKRESWMLSVWFVVPLLIYLAYNFTKLLSFLTACCSKKSSINLNWRVWPTCVLRLLRKPKLWFLGEHFCVPKGVLCTFQWSKASYGQTPSPQSNSVDEKTFHLSFSILTHCSESEAILSIPNALQIIFTGLRVIEL